MNVIIFEVRKVAKGGHYDYSPRTPKRPSYATATKYKHCIFITKTTWSMTFPETSTLI
jgi:hypothetical protein